MTALDLARTKMLNLFNDVEATEKRLQNTETVAEHEAVKELLIIFEQDFNVAWDAWSLELQKTRLEKVFG